MIRQTEQEKHLISPFWADWDWDHGMGEKVIARMAKERKKVFEDGPAEIMIRERTNMLDKWSKLEWQLIRKVL